VFGVKNLEIMFQVYDGNSTKETLTLKAAYNHPNLFEVLYNQSYNRLEGLEGLDRLDRLFKIIT
jgi:hypothetical protein